MPEPIVEQIAAAVETRLLTVTIANGYQVDIAGVLRPTQLGLDSIAPRPLLAMMLQIDPYLDDSKNHPKGLGPDIGPPLIHWVQPWAIALFVQTSERATPPLPADTLINRFRASVEKALMVDPGWGATPTTALAYRTDLVPPIYFPETEGGFVGCSVILEAGYRTLETDPYTQPTK